MRHYFLFIILFFSVLNTAYSASPRQAYLIMDADSGKILSSYNAHKRVYPASLTKIMTIYMIFDALKHKKITMNTKLRVSKRASRMSPSKLYLKAGATITVKNAIKALITKSANDVAATVAENLGKSEKNFARMMTQKARHIGMYNTVFRNASGLPHSKQVTNAKDMAILAIRIIRDFPQYYGLFKTKSFRYQGRTYRNHNKLLSKYPGTDGIKTGFIRASGFNLVSSVKRHNRRLIGVIFGGKTGNQRNAKMMKILNKGFSIIDKQRYSTQIVQAPLQSILSYKNYFTDNTEITLNNSNILTSHVKTTAAPTSILRQIISSTKNTAEIKNIWAIQVGAYKNLEMAKKHADKVANLLRKKFNYLQSHFVPNRRTIYKVRFIHLSKSEAFAACLHLQKYKIDCFAVKPKPLKQVQVATLR